MAKIKGYYVEFRITPIEWHETETIQRVDDTENDYACVKAESTEEAEEKVFAYLRSLPYYDPTEIPGGVITYDFEVMETIPNVEFDLELEPDLLVIQ